MSACCFISSSYVLLPPNFFQRNARRKVSVKQIISSELIAEAEYEAPTPCRFKKNVALWVGYVGTEYRGLQIQRGVAGIRSVEDELERAIYKCGGILESNHESLGKIGWRRSSRTDKGVSFIYYLCFKNFSFFSFLFSPGFCFLTSFFVGSGSFFVHGDNHEAGNHCKSMDIRVFGVVPVTRKFNARKSCYSRTYDYYFPASCIGIKSDSTSPNIEQKLELFRSTLKCFEGRHAFHNYTVRKRYRTSQRKCFKNQKMKNDSPPEEDDDDETEEEELNINPQAPKLRAYWVDESEETTDVVGGSHYRTITAFSCEGFEKLADHLVVKVRVTGESFMVHQIRKMIGTAIAVAREIFPADTVPISLNPQARMILPIAPSQGLLLSGNSFFPFKGGHARAQGGAGFYFSKLGIQISDSISQRMNSFWIQKLSPAIAESMNELQAPWNTWLESLVSCSIPDSELDALRKP